MVLRRVAAARGVSVNLVIATLGLSYVLKGAVRATGFGDTPRSFPSVVPDGSVTLGQASLSYLDLAILVTALAVMAAFFAVFNLTRTGGRCGGRHEPARRPARRQSISAAPSGWSGSSSGGISAIAAILFARSS